MKLGLFVGVGARKAEVIFCTITYFESIFGYRINYTKSKVLYLCIKTMETNTGINNMGYTYLIHIFLFIISHEVLVDI